jgi:tetratricopeptide (TPR) repeat protein
MKTRQFKRAIDAHKAGNDKRALELFAEALKQDASNATIYHNISVLLAKNQDFKEAYTQIKKAVELAPDALSIRQTFLKISKILGNESSIQEITEADGSDDHTRISSADNLQEQNSLGNSANNPKKKLNKLIQAYKEGNFNEVIQNSNEFTDNSFNSLEALNVIACAYLQTKQYQKAIEKFNYLISNGKENSIILNNLGSAYLKKNDLQSAENYLSLALQKKPDYVEALHNMGLLKNKKQQFEESIPFFKQAVELNPNFYDAQQALANSYQVIGQIKNAEEVALNFFLLAKSNSCKNLPLIKFLNDCDTKLKPKNKLYNADQSLRAIAISQKKKFGYSQDEVVQTYKKIRTVLLKHDITTQVPTNQIYCGPQFELGCSRHHSIFTKHNIIPKFCFDCYKVQIEPPSIYELIRVMFILKCNFFKLNLISKCMLEQRSSVAGRYKALVYCKSSSEMKKVHRRLSKATILSGYKISMKRGCSEFAQKYPNYGDVGIKKNQQLSYKKSWQKVEQEYDDTYPKDANYFSPYLRTIFNEISLQDALVTQNWINYAKRIEDKTVSLFR